MDRKTFTHLISISLTLLFSIFAQQVYADTFTVTCIDGRSSCTGGTSATQDITGFLNGSFNTGVCSGSECIINGQALTDDASYPCYFAGSSCSNSSSGLYDITCSTDSCTFDIDASKCGDSAENEALCGGLLPNGTLANKEPANRIAFRKTLDGFCDNQANSNEALCQLIGESDDNLRETIFMSLWPDNLDAGIDSSQQAITEALQYISNHLQLLRTGSIAYSDQDKERARQYYANQQWYNAYQQLAANESTGNDAQPTSREATINVSEDGKLSMYVNAAYLVAKQSLSDSEGKSSTKAATLTIGGDYRLTANTILGAALSFTDSQTKYGAADSELDTQMFNLIAYSSFYIKQLWIDLSASYGINNFDQNRNIICPNAACSTLNNTYQADYDGATASLNFGVGYDFNLQAWTLSPFVQYSGGQNTTDGYREKAKKQGVPVALLELDKQKRYFSTLSTGAYVRYVINTKKAALIPTLRLRVNRELKDKAANISGRLLGASNSDFVLQTNAADNTYAAIGMGLSFQLQNGNSGFFDIETTEAYDNLDQYKATFGWRWEF